ncbi:MAG: hypothetical protein J2P36_01350 [Ktedonobacteraceae bacterium]|nr:hypothetical protein [Ktedonobacteraceae bacterium]
MKWRKRGWIILRQGLLPAALMFVINVSLLVTIMLNSILQGLPHLNNILEYFWLFRFEQVALTVHFVAAMILFFFAGKSAACQTKRVQTSVFAGILGSIVYSVSALAVSFFLSPHLMGIGNDLLNRCPPHEGCLLIDRFFYTPFPEMLMIAIVLEGLLLGWIASSVGGQVALRQHRERILRLMPDRVTVSLALILLVGTGYLLAIAIMLFMVFPFM